MIKQKLIYSVLIALLLVALVVIYYYHIGGFAPVEVYVVEGEQRTIIGKEYVIKADGKQYTKIMSEAKSKLDSGFLTGELTALINLSYQSEDSIKIFVGSSFEGFRNILQIPSGYSYKELSSDTIFRVYLTQKSEARPTPERIDKLVNMKVKETNSRIPSLSMEIYYPDHSLRIEYWVK